MNRVLKYAAFSLAAFALLLLAALAVLAAVVDGAFVKSRLERFMKDEKNRTLRIEGEPRLRLFPVAGLALGRTVLSEPGSERPFVSLDSADVALRVMPLLQGEIVVEAFSLAGLDVQVKKGRDGRMNFADLAGSGTQAQQTEGRPGAAAEGKAAPRITLAEISVDRARFAYQDEGTGQEAVVEGLDVRMGRLEDNVTSPVSVAVSVSGRRPDIAMKVAITGSARLDLAHQMIALSGIDARISGGAATLKGLDFHLKGDVAADGRGSRIEVNGLDLAVSAMLDRDALTAAFSAPRISITPEKATGSAVKGSIRIAGPERRVQTMLEIAAVEGTSAALSVPGVKLSFDAEAGGRHLAGRVGTPVKASLDAGTWELPGIAADLVVSGPSAIRKTILLQASAKADLRRQNLAVDAKLKLDEKDAQLKFTASRFRPLDANFDFNAEHLNLDDYLAPKKEPSKPDEPIDLAGLIGPSVNGRVRIGALQASNVKVSELKAELKLAGGRLEVAPITAGLYQGTLNGSLGVEAKGNRVSLKQSVQGVQINPLLRDLADKDIVEGRGDVSVDVSTAGATVEQMKKALAGSVKFALKDGAYKGLNLAEGVRKVTGVLGSRASSQSTGQSADRSQKTDFSEMSASFAIKGGVAHNDDLAMKSPFVRVGGSGDVDIGKATVNYLAKASLVATATGQQGTDDAAGITIPVKIYGPLNAVKYDIDYSGVLGLDKLGSRLGGLFGGKSGADSKGGSKGASPVDTVRNKLKGLFGR